MEVTMVSNNHGCESHNQMSVNRRRFVKAAGAAGIAGLAGCTGGQPSSESTGGATTGKSSNSEPTKLTYWTLFSGGDGAAMKTLVGKFNEEHDSIQIQRERQPYDEYYDKLFTSATSGDAPDLAVMHASQQRRFQDAIVPIEEHLDGGIDEKYVSSIWDRTKLDGKKYGLPLDTFVNGLYYNKDIFEEAGLDPEKPPTNFSELEEAANAITENTDKLAFNRMGGCTTGRSTRSSNRAVETSSQTTGRPLRSTLTSVVSSHSSTLTSPENTAGINPTLPTIEESKASAPVTSR